MLRQGLHLLVFAAAALVMFVLGLADALSVPEYLVVAGRAHMLGRWPPTIVLVSGIFAFVIFLCVGLAVASFRKRRYRRAWLTLALPLIPLVVGLTIRLA